MSDFDTVRDIPDGKEYSLVTGSHERDHILQHIGENPEDWSHCGLFVKVENADYTEVWAFPGNVPYLHKSVTQIK